MREWAPVGIEGVVAKRLFGVYQGGIRGWEKIRVRHTSDAIVAAVTGRVHAPSSLVLGRFDADGRLHFVGRTTPSIRSAPAALAVRFSSLLADTRGPGPRLSGAARRPEPAGVLQTKWVGRLEVLS